MKKILFSLFGIFILLALPLQAMEIDMSVLNDVSKEISKDLHVPTIVGDDDREEITGKATGPEKAVVVIEIKKSDTKYLCSGAVVGTNTVLTAAHCLVDKEENYAEQVRVYAVGVSKLQKAIEKETGSFDITDIIFDPEYRNSKDIKQKNGYIENITEKQIEHKKWIYDKSGKKLYPFATAKQLWIPNQYIQALREDTNYIIYDYAIIVLNWDLSKETGWLGLKILSYKELDNANIIAIGRGGDKPERTLWKSSGKIGVVSSHGIAYDTDILHGNSGGPIFKEDDPQNIIALVNWDNGDYVENGYPNSGLRINQEIIDAVKNVKNSKLNMYRLSDDN